MNFLFGWYDRNEEAAHRLESLSRETIEAARRSQRSAIESTMKADDAREAIEELLTRLELRKDEKRKA